MTPNIGNQYIVGPGQNTCIPDTTTNIPGCGPWKPLFNFVTFMKMRNYICLHIRSFTDKPNCMWVLRINIYVNHTTSALNCLTFIVYLYHLYSFFSETGPDIILDVLQGLSLLLLFLQSMRLPLFPICFLFLINLYVSNTERYQLIRCIKLYTTHQHH